jgi:hypothetical protein
MDGRHGLTAIGQNDTDFQLDVTGLDGDTVTGLVPRLRLVGVEEVTVRFAKDGRPWRARFELETAELHTAEQALVTLRLLEIGADGTGRIAPRVAVHAPGMLKATLCRNVVRGNEYTIRVDDVSETGFQFTSEVDLVRGDTFRVAFEAAGRRLRLEGKAMTVAPGPYGRNVVGAQIIGSAPGDMLTISELVGGS